jgi:uncharacterized protein (DUF849 family)
MEQPSKVDINLSSALNLPEPIVDILPAIPDRASIAPRTGGDDDHREATDDYTEVRENLKRVIIQSEEATQGILEVAQESQNPRAYEVVAQLISATLEANNKLMHLHKQMKDIKKQDEVKQTTITNNSIFVGNTADLQRMIREARRKDPPNAP